MTRQFLLGIPPTVVAIVIGIAITLLMQKVDPRRWGSER